MFDSEIRYDEKPTDQEVNELKDIVARRKHVVDEIFKLVTLRDSIDNERTKWHKNQHGKVYCIAIIDKGYDAFTCSRKNGSGPGGRYCWQHAKQFKGKPDAYADFFGVS
jgi:hypothetical protein